jgi:electron transfer flavoprotein-quinone oxidoreductase
MGADVDKVDVIVVGAGLAGLACALEAARRELAVLVVERGDHPGAKNVSGGRLYLAPVRDMMPEGFFDDAPLERPVTHESLCLMTPRSSMTLDFTSESLRAGPPRSYSVLRSRFDRWFGERAEAAGAFVVPQAVAGGLLREDGRVVGVRAGDEELVADVVVAADGALSLLSREAGLAPELSPRGQAMGIKQVIGLDSGRIEDRFALLTGEGAARLFLGDVTRSMVGGGFLYTNAETVSVGIVIDLEELAGRTPDAEGTHEIMDAFLERPEIRPLVAGGETVEYSAHLIPEMSHDALPRRVTDGMLVAGDAAGFTINHGVTVRGMDLALASGVLAARAIAEAKEAGDFSADGLGAYDRLLADSFVIKDLVAHGRTGEFLRRRRLYDVYPRALCDVLEGLFEVGPGGKERLYPAAWRKLRATLVNMEGLKDFWAARRI